MSKSLDSLDQILVTDSNSLSVTGPGMIISGAPYQLDQLFGA